MLKLNGKIYKQEKIRTGYIKGVPQYKTYFFDFGKMGGTGFGGYSFNNKKKVSLSALRKAADFVFNLTAKKPSLTDDYFMEKFMDSKTIKKAIKRVKNEKNVDAKTKEFLVAWLSDGLDGPDQLLKEEIALNN
jgi:hypothetical protein